jgi:hypothetical protein
MSQWAAFSSLKGRRQYPPQIRFSDAALAFETYGVLYGSANMRCFFFEIALGDPTSVRMLVALKRPDLGRPPNTFGFALLGS